MKLRALLVGFVWVALTASALAAGPYIGAGGGLSSTHESNLAVDGISATGEFNTGYGFNLSAGYNFDPVRLELEFGYKNADLDNVKVTVFSSPAIDTNFTVMSYLVNVYYDIKTDSAFRPYVGAGLGLLIGQLKSASGKDDGDQAFGYQVIAGVAYNVNKHVAIDLSYRLLGAAEPFSDIGKRAYFMDPSYKDLTYMSSNYLVGLRYNF